MIADYCDAAKTISYKDRIMAEIDTGSLSVANMQIDTGVHCSIILLAGDDCSKLNTYLLYLSQAKLPIDYELVIVCTRKLQIDERLLRALVPASRILNVSGATSQEQLFDIAAKAARGAFLLFVRTFVNFDKLALILLFISVSIKLARAAR